MEKLNNFIKSRDIGFWVTLVVAIINLVLIIVYPTSFFYTSYYEPLAELFFSIGFAIGVLLIVASIFKNIFSSLAPVTFGLGIFVGIIYFVIGAWFMIQDAFGGYEELGFLPGFWPVVILAVISIVASIVNIIWLKQVKAADEE